MEEEFKFGTGGIIDEYDRRDYHWDELGRSSEPFDWDKGYDIEQEIGKKLTIKDQDGSSSCGGQAWGYYGQVLDSSHVEQSAKFIYYHTNAPGGGSSGRANSGFVKNTGWAPESIVVSYDNGHPAKESYYLNGSNISPEAYAVAKKHKATSYASIYDITIDLLAKSLRDNKGVIILIEGQNNGTWRSEFPKPPKGRSNIWRHWVYIGKAKKINGEKMVGFINSWGNVGDKGWQWIDEDYMPNILSAWTLVKETGVLYATLRRGSKGEQVKILQQKLGGLATDGIFGRLTDAAVKKFQKDNGLVVDGIVGPITRKALN